MCCGVELHDKFLIPLCELLPNKFCYSTSFEAVLHSRVVLFVVLDVLPIDPSHVTDNWLLVQQDCLIEVLLFLSMELVVYSSPSPGSIGILCSPFSQSRVSPDFHILSHRMSIIVVWDLGLQFSQHLAFLFFSRFRHWGLVFLRCWDAPSIPLWFWLWSWLGLGSGLGGFLW